MYKPNKVFQEHKNCWSLPTSTPPVRWTSCFLPKINFRKLTIAFCSKGSSESRMRSLCVCIASLIPTLAPFWKGRDLFFHFLNSKIENTTALVTTLLQYNALQLIGHYINKNGNQCNFSASCWWVHQCHWFCQLNSATDLWVEGIKFMVPKKYICLLYIWIWLIWCFCK